jgi:preprotein translocase subunit SecE
LFTERGRSKRVIPDSYILTVLALAKTKNFVSDIVVELKKCSWPWDPKEKGMKKYKELVDSTVIVVIAMLLLAGYISTWDFIMNVLVGFMFGTPQH